MEIALNVIMDADIARIRILDKTVIFAMIKTFLLGIRIYL